MFIWSLISLVALILDYGYRLNYWMHLGTDVFYLLFALIFFTFHIQQYQDKKKGESGFKGYIASLILTSILLILAIANTTNFLLNESPVLNFYTAGLVFILTLTDLSGRLYKLDRQTLHPALVFVLSFVVLICIGTLLLMAPKATYSGISFIDALFTSTSAVCVTGLVVLDTGKDFTMTGQLTILGLIQLGALGMLSFTSLFALFFRGFGSFESRLNLKNMINAESLEDTFKTLLQIILFVFLVEVTGAILIFFTADLPFESLSEKAFFSLFHAVSGFCNAGFSTLTNSLYEEGYQHQYGLHLIIAVLIILGGLGYGVVINLYRYIKKWFYYLLQRYFNIHSTDQMLRLRPHVSLNTRIVLVTTLILILFGSLLFFLLEYDNTMKGYSLWGKIATSLFGSITTRTAGFNTVDTGALSYSTIMIVILLMWIGASPGSTGGGIKTTTFAVATLNIIQQVFGFKNIRVGFKKIPQKALHRATAIISLSLIMIGLSTFLLVTFDGELGVIQLAFESFSAFSTVGLSMGVTAQLSDLSKFILVITMFVGRVGFLTLLTGMVRQIVRYKYSPIDYPEEDIFIN